jgi:hypothetical protein
MILINALVAVVIAAAAIPYPNLRTYPTECKSLAYQEYGAGKPIVLLAGGPGMNPAYMVPVAEMLASGGAVCCFFTNVELGGRLMQFLAEIA